MNKLRVLLCALSLAACSSCSVDTDSPLASDHNKNSAKRTPGKAMAPGHIPRPKRIDHFIDFEAETLSGEKKQVGALAINAKYLLVEFWASWCHPCRKEIPHLKEAYKKYADRGFEIVSLSIDSDHDAWQEASDAEQLPWPNLGDMRGSESPIKAEYGVSGIPASFLVEVTSGKVLATNLRKEKLDQFLSKLFP